MPKAEKRNSLNSADADKVIDAAGSTVQKKPVRDISRQRKQAGHKPGEMEEKSLIENIRESERLYRLVTENATDVIWTSDMDGNTTYISPSVTVVRGFSVEEAMHQSLEQRYATGSIAMVRDIFRNTQAREARGDMQPGNIELFEAEHLKKDGTSLWMETRASFIRDQNGQAIGIFGVSRDISQRKVAEAAIHKQRKEYRTIFDSVPSIIAYISTEGRIIRINRAGAQALGLLPRQVVGKTFHDFFSHEDADRLLSRSRQVMISGVPIRNSISSVTLPSGQLFWTQTDIIPYLDENGNIIGSINVVHDITDRKQMESNIEESFFKLNKTLQDIITAMSMIVELKDPYTAGHQRRVAQLAAAIAGKSGLPDEKVDYIRTAAVIHDIGKLYVPTDIMSKPGKLSDLEYSIVKTHAQSSYDILKSIDFPWPIAMIAWQHHERTDGSGYPNNLKEDEMLPEARILAVADVVEAMSSHRPYRPALHIDAALQEISTNRGKLYDPEVVDICLALFNNGEFEFK